MCLSLKVKRPECVLSEGLHKGFEWATVHNEMGYRCGYVRVPVGHPWHGKEYDDVDAEVHGGLTFSEHDTECDKPGDDSAWWLGFDCAHAGDAPDPTLPATYRREAWEGDVVRTQEYVEAECRSLCEQAAQVEAILEEERLQDEQDGGQFGMGA